VLEMGDLKMAGFCVQHAAFMSGLNSSIKSMRSNKHQQQDDNTAHGSGGGGGNAPSRLTQTSFQSTITSSSSSNESVTQQAVVFSFLKQYNQAIAILEHEVRLKPSSDLYNLLGRILMRAKKWREAVDAFDKSIEILVCVICFLLYIFNQPGPANLFFLWKIDESKNPSRSMTKLNQTTSQLASMLSKTSRKDLIDAYFMKGQSWLEYSKYDEAHKAFDKVLEIDVNNAQAYYHRGLARAHLSQAKSIQDFNKALSLDPDLFQAFLARACVYGSHGRYTKAILNCNQAIRINPKSVRSFLYR
jgi:tetratricopeptide (TPR) repeat protein